MIKLIATDLDGTLLTSDHTVTPRTLRALAAAREAGLHVVPASGRQPFSIGEVLAGTFLADGVVLGANGAVGYDLGRDAVLFETTLAVEAHTALFHALRERHPGIHCVSVRDGGATFVPQHGYVGMMDPEDHSRPGDLPEFPLTEVLSVPSVKLVVRDPAVAPEELLATALELDLPGVAPSTSGAPFLEVASAGVDKGTGLVRIAGALGVRADEVIAFGDNLNDLEMLAWAGHGVAMGNALPEVIAVADEVAPTNNDEGIAAVIERLAVNGWRV